jgi:hypothetical protein
MATRMQRCLGPARYLEPGEYTVETASGRPAIRCASCGTIAELRPETHRVERGGLVVPVWSCERCAALDFLILDDYDEPVVPR